MHTQAKPGHRQAEQQQSTQLTTSSYSPTFSLSGANPYPQAANDASFCDRLLSYNGYDYTDPTHAYSLMFIMVQRAYNGAEVNGSTIPPTLGDVQGLKHNPNTIGYFDGTIDYRNTAGNTSPFAGTPTPNLQTDRVAALALDDKIARYLGLGFGCTGGPVGSPAFQATYPYNAPSMTAVHSGMAITQLQFAAFIKSEDETTQCKRAPTHISGRCSLSFSLSLFLSP